LNIFFILFFHCSYRTFPDTMLQHIFIKIFLYRKIFCKHNGKRTRTSKEIYVDILAVIIAHHQNYMYFKHFVKKEHTLGTVCFITLVTTIKMAVTLPVFQYTSLPGFTFPMPFLAYSRIWKLYLLIIYTVKYKDSISYFEIITILYD
jgi:hypothetical protein